MILQISIPWVEPDAEDGTKGAKSTRYVTVSGTLSSKESDAMSLEFRQPRHRDRIALKLAEHEFAGGLAKHSGLERDAHDLAATLRGRAIRALWGETIPEDISDVVASRMINVFIAASDDPEVAQLSQMQDLQEQIAFYAEWRVLIVNPPRGWESIADRPSDGPDDNDIFQYAWIRYREARAAEAAGKLPPSAS